MKKIPVFSPLIDESMLNHIDYAFKKKWLGMGSFTKEFEERISKYLKLNNRYVICTNTGTSALHLGLKVAGIKKNDEVITPSFNYVADHQAIKMAGGDVVMCDIDEHNLGINCENIIELISERTKAIIPLSFAGIPFDQRLYKIAKKYNLRVIEDATHSFGTSVQQKKIGSYGDITCFSFDPVKVITSIDGGCVIVNNKKERDSLRNFRFLGVDKETEYRYKNKRAWDYDVITEGYRYHLTNILASVGISQIKKINQIISSRRKVCCKYNESFKNLPNIIIPNSDFSEISPFIYYLRITDNKRKKFIEHMDSLGIDLGIHFNPVHKHKFFKKCKKGKMKNTDKISKEIVTIPLHSFMNENSINRVIKAVKKF